MCRTNAAWLLGCCCCCLLLSVSGCGRSAVVVAPEVPAADLPAERVVRAQAGESEGEATRFPFPEDRGGALLARVLSPTETAAPQEERRTSGPTRSPAPRRLELPASPLPPGDASLPRLPLERSKRMIRPRLVVEETLDGWADPVPPAGQKLYAGERAREVSEDANRPAPLPILAQPVADRASLDDPTADASLAAVTSGALPRRLQPAPFLRLVLPDPYENRRPLGVAAPAEDTAPSTATPLLPRR
jgi:hypothetical protein